MKISRLEHVNDHVLATEVRVVHCHRWWKLGAWLWPRNKTFKIQPSCGKYLVTVHWNCRCIIHKEYSQKVWKSSLSLTWTPKRGWNKKCYVDRREKSQLFLNTRPHTSVATSVVIESFLLQPAHIIIISPHRSEFDPEDDDFFMIYQLQLGRS